MSNKKLITLTKFKKLEKIKNLQNSKTQNLKLSFMNKIGYLQHSKMVIILFGSQEFFRSQRGPGRSKFALNQFHIMASN